MKLRHAAALALVSWLLMIPPLLPNTHRVNRDAALSHWVIRGKFPRSQGCEAAKFRARKAGLAEQADPSRRRANPDLYCDRCAAECVEDNDPRLKRK